LGYYKSEVEAARAYDKASVRFRGARARVNFESIKPKELRAKEMSGPEKKSKRGFCASAESSNTLASAIESSASPLQHILSSPSLHLLLSINSKVYLLHCCFSQKNN